MLRLQKQMGDVKKHETSKSQKEMLKDGRHCNGRKKVCVASSVNMMRPEE